MAQNREIGELGQIVTVDTSANSLTVNGSIILGNSSSNVVINSTAISFGGITQTDRSFTWTNTHTFTNTVSIAALSANGTLGLSSQVLTTNGTGIYWSSAGVNTNATYTWSNAHTFNGIVTFAQTAVGTVNNALYFNGSSLSTVQGQITSNASAAYTNAVSYTDGKILTANSAITGNAATAYSNAVSYVDGKVLTANAAITGNAATAYTNAVSYTDSKILTANGAITGNATTAYTNATIFASNASNINTGTLAEARLPYRMNQNVTTTNNVTFGDLTLTGNLYVGSNVNVIGSNNLSIVDNMIYLNANNTVANPDLGFAGNYNDGIYHHAGFFRDASDSGTWKVFDNYLPEPDANTYIDTTNTTFHLANFQANTLNAGNTSTNWFIANTAGAYLTGTVNATSYTVGTAFTANATIVNAVSFYAGTTLIGNTTGPYGKTEGSLNVNSALTSNNSSYLGGVAAASYQLNSTLNANIASYLPTYTGIVNAASHTVGTSFTANATVVNAVSFYAGTTLIGNTTGPYGKTEATLNVNSALTANNSTNLGGTSAASYQLNSTLNANIASYLPTYTGIVNGASHTVGSSFVVNSSTLFIGTTIGVSANGSIGSSGQVLTSNATTVYWASPAATGVTSVGTGNGLSGGPITTTGTVSVLANNGITANSTGLFVTQGTGAVVNSTGVHVNSTYIGTLSANNTTYVNGKTEGNLNVNSATYATSAGSATNASAATNATYATSAGSATNATTATNSTNATTSTTQTFNTSGTSIATTQFATRAIFGARSAMNLTGGGTVTYSGGYVLWSTRFIVIGDNKGTEAPNNSTTTYFDINCPTSGSVDVVGTTAVTATASGIPLGAWQALYYDATQGSGAGVSAFHIISYSSGTANYAVPAGWVLIAVVNGDSGYCRFANGLRLLSGRSYAVGTYDSYYIPTAASATNASAATNATYATSAGSATNASAATNATYATSAGSATNASAATNATTATNLSGGSVAATSGTFSSDLALTTVPFFLNTQTVASNYTVANNYNAMTTGPITINTGVTVTVNTGATWVVL